MSMTSSEVIYKGRHYSACSMQDGSLIVTKNKTQEGMRMIGENAAYWIDDIRTAIDDSEAHALCRALFVS